MGVLDAMGNFEETIHVIFPSSLIGPNSIKNSTRGHFPLIIKCAGIGVTNTTTTEIWFHDTPQGCSKKPVLLILSGETKYYVENVYWVWWVISEEWKE